MARQAVQTKPVSAGIAKARFEATITDKQGHYPFWRLDPTVSPAT
jgi:hypothetical protein